MKPSFVIDASVIIAWCNPDENNRYAEGILDCLRHDIAIAPPLCCLEVNNVLWMLEKKNRVSHFDVEKIIASINHLPIIRDNTPLDFQIPLVSSLARHYSLTIYDACYLELATRLNLPLATLDQQLIHAAEAAGIGIKAQNAT